MATTSFLYHSLGLVGYKHLRTEYEDGCIYHHVVRRRHKRSCRNCSARWFDLVMAGEFIRTFHALPIGSRVQYIVLHGHEQLCKRCGKTLREPIPFTKGKRRHIKAFARFVIELCGLMPIKHVARLLRVGWDLVKDISKEHLSNRLKKRKFSKIRYIAVDEFSIRKSHHYLTVALDLETGEILYAHEGRNSQVLIPFFNKLKRSGSQLKAVAMDMWEAYMSAVYQVFKGTVDIVHDPYHIVAQANRAIDETRREMVRHLYGEERKALKGSRFLLLKGMEKLKPESLERLMILMELNEPLYQAYLLKEELRMFWNVPDKETGLQFLESWVIEARATGLRQFRKLANMLDKHRPGLLAYFDHRISTGPLEGMNNKIKTLKRQAYGFRDIDYFKLRLYFLHEAHMYLSG